jgi:hypothetical protein
MLEVEVAVLKKMLVVRSVPAEAVLGLVTVTFEIENPLSELLFELKVVLEAVLLNLPILFSKHPDAKKASRRKVILRELGDFLILVATHT